MGFGTARRANRPPVRMEAAGGWMPGRDLLEDRVRAIGALTDAPAEEIRRRLINAPRRYLLVSDAETIVRHWGLTESMPGPRDARLLPVHLGGDEWRLDVAICDRHGALAAITGALAGASISVKSASISTWRNGLAIDTFIVEAPSSPDWNDLRRRMEAALVAGVTGINSEPIDAEITIDNTTSPWLTLIDVLATDRVGLLSRVASALSMAGVDIHFAIVETKDGRAVDSFRVTGRKGSKLDEAGQRAVRRAFAGHSSRRFRFR